MPLKCRNLKGRTVIIHFWIIICHMASQNSGEGRLNVKRGRRRRSNSNEHGGVLPVSALIAIYASCVINTTAFLYIYSQQLEWQVWLTIEQLHQQAARLLNSTKGSTRYLNDTNSFSIFCDIIPKIRPLLGMSNLSVSFRYRVEFCCLLMVLSILYTGRILKFVLNGRRQFSVMD